MSMFYNNGDPLLTSTAYSLFNSGPNPSDNSMDTYAQMYKQQLMMEMQRQQQQEMNQDWLGILDKNMKSLDGTSAEMLNNDSEFISLNSQLQTLIQSEIMNLVKIKINSNPNAVENMKRQMELMKTTTQKVQMEEKQNIADLNDYVKNYSHLTFDEYKNLKSNNSGKINVAPQEQIEIEVATKTAKKTK